MSNRYTILGTIAKGGMGSVYLARMSGSAGFSRLVAIKRLHPELAAERDFVAMLVDEARMASRIRHANVIDTLDLVVSAGAFSLVLEYIDGESLASLIREAQKREEPISVPIALSVMYGVLRGLDAAHETRSDDNLPLGLVHRDVSPQNVLVGIDGIPRVIDFGVAKALGKLESTRPGEVRGKFSYMAPEQLLGRPLTRQADVYAVGVVLWELLTGQRLFTGEDWRAISKAVLSQTIPKPSSVNPEIPAELDAVVLKATARDVAYRYLTAKELLDDLERFPRAREDEVGSCVKRLAAERLAARQKLVQGAPPSDEGGSVEDVIADLALATESHAPPEDEAPTTPKTPVKQWSEADTVAASELPSLAQAPSSRRRGILIAVTGMALTVLVGGTIALARKDMPSQAPPAPAVSDPPPVVLLPPEPTPAQTPTAVASPAPSPSPSPSTSSSSKRRPARPPPPSPAPTSTSRDPGSFR